MPDNIAQVPSIPAPGDSSRLTLAACDVVRSLPHQPCDSWEDVTDRLTRNATNPQWPNTTVSAEAMARLIRTLIAGGVLD